MKIEYKIVSGEDGNVQQEVNQYLKEGWELYGPLTMAIEAEKQLVICAQAMIKKSGS